ncbi:baculoviral IAP repeat-containing protein 3-like isoform X2 [Liolophura sinensis]|uniref:baculoviral IAP repeat-containing protein 3-like isoform X2 n=1 Tax=Liolophura sinensis TaxID=3198878 RepID=UPI003159647A
MASSSASSEARYSHYADRAARVNSFVGWPSNSGQRPEELAHAGLFYAGVDDCTRCFSCGGGLRNWLPGDDPIVQHARFFPECQYIIGLKGEAFVANVNRAYERENFMADAQVDVSDSSEPAQVLGYEQMVQRVMRKLCVMDFGFPRSLIHDAVLKLLSENGWDESLLTLKLLVSVCLELKDAEENGATSDEGDFEEKSVRGDEMAERISQENRDMKESLKCKICLNKEVTMVFLPCGHLVTCMDCYLMVTHCPFCRTKIMTYVRAIFN